MQNTPQQRVNYKKWSLVIAAISAAAAVAAVVIKFPAVSCASGLNPGACRAQLREVELITQSETGEPLSNVKVQVIAKGAPEVQYTDNNGYIKVQIPSEGDVRVNLTKDGYPSQDFNLNVENSPSTVRIVRFSESGQPDIEELATTVGSPSETVNSNAPVVATQIQSSRGIYFQLRGCQQESDVLTCELLTTDKDSERALTIYASSGSRTSRIIDLQGNQYLPSSVNFGGAGNRGYIKQNLVQDIPLKASLVFDDIQIEDNQLALLEVVGYTQDQSYFSVQFRDVDLLK